MLGWIGNDLQGVYHYARGALIIKRKDEKICENLTPYLFKSYIFMTVPISQRLVVQDHERCLWSHDVAFSAMNGQSSFSSAYV